MTQIAIIAGNGDFPVEVAEALTLRNQGVFIVGIRGEADERIETYPHTWFEWGQVGRLFKALKSNDVHKVMLAGGVVGRPDLKLKNFDLGAFLTLPTVLSSLLAGDNEILTSVITVFEKRGFDVIGCGDAVPELLVSSGNNTSARPRADDQRMIDEGRRLISTLGSFDVGQACVVAGKRVVAIEGVEGTDEMLSRISYMREIGRLPDRQGGLLVKAPKTGQDERADLPTIGPQTILNAQAAQLRGLAVEAGKTIILQREETVRLADEAGLFLYGFGSGDQL